MQVAYTRKSERLDLPVYLRRPALLKERELMDDTSQEHRNDMTVDEAIRLTAPGTPLRLALDMILAGHLGALICVGDTEHVLEAGNDGFPLNISFTANRLFELSKMDGAIVIDRGLNQILRANFHLNPDPSLPTAETGMRHRTAARMSLLTDALVISVSERRQVVHGYLRGKAFQLQTVSELMTSVSQLLSTLQTTRQALDRWLLRLTSLELDNFVTLEDITKICNQFELLVTTNEDLSKRIAQLGTEGRTVEMQRTQLMGDMSDSYTLMIRDYARDSSTLAAKNIRKQLHALSQKREVDAEAVARALGYEGLSEDSILAPLGLRTLTRISVIRENMAEEIVDEYGSLGELLNDITEHPDRLDQLGVKNTSLFTSALEALHSGVQK